MTQSIQGFSTVGSNVWELPAMGKMHVPVRAIASEALLKKMDAKAIEQAMSAAKLPGILRASYMLPDAHQGYGFPIGGVAAFDAKEGIIVPGAIGFDINCGMRLIATNLTHKEVRPKIKPLIDELFVKIPSGVACRGSIHLKSKEMDEVLRGGAEWAIEKGFGWKKDLAFLEENGKMKNANPNDVSAKAKGRGQNQLGTLGSGNHYLEIQTTASETIFDTEIAETFGVEDPEQVFIMVHCGSRGVGHQVATEYLEKFMDYSKKNKIALSDKELAFAPIESEEGKEYFSAMQCAANYAFANRQIITHEIRNAFEKIFKTPAEEMGMHVIYDVTHNVAKMEKYKLNGKIKNVLVHRKGATRAFGPQNDALPRAYRETGQPVIVGGSMQTGSFVCAGTTHAEKETFSSTMHGAGRTMSRHAAKQQNTGKKILEEMLAQGIYVRSASMQGLAEEAGAAYKDIFEVVEAAHEAGISKKVFALRPLGNIKG